MVSNALNPSYIPSRRDVLVTRGNPPEIYRIVRTAGVVSDSRLLHGQPTYRIVTDHRASIGNGGFENFTSSRDRVTVVIYAVSLCSDNACESPSDGIIEEMNMAVNDFAIVGNSDWQGYVAILLCFTNLEEYLTRLESGPPGQYIRTYLPDHYGSSDTSAVKQLVWQKFRDRAGPNNRDRLFHCWVENDEFADLRVLDNVVQDTLRRNFPSIPAST